VYLYINYMMYCHKWELIANCSSDRSKNIKTYISNDGTLSMDVAYKSIMTFITVYNGHGDKMDYVLPEEGHGYIYNATFSNDNRYVALAVYDFVSYGDDGKSSILVVNLETCDILEWYDCFFDENCSHCTIVNMFTFSYDSVYLYVVTGSVYVCDIRKPHYNNINYVHGPKMIDCVVAHPSDNNIFIVSGLVSFSVIYYNSIICDHNRLYIGCDKCIRQYPANECQITSSSFLPVKNANEYTSHLFATVDDNGNIRIWDILPLSNDEYIYVQPLYEMTIGSIYRITSCAYINDVFIISYYDKHYIAEPGISGKSYIAAYSFNQDNTLTLCTIHEIDHCHIKSIAAYKQNKYRFTLSTGDIYTFAPLYPVCSTWTPSMYSRFYSLYTPTIDLIYRVMRIFTTRVNICDDTIVCLENSVNRSKDIATLKAYKATLPPVLPPEIWNYIVSVAVEQITLDITSEL